MNLLERVKELCLEKGVAQRKLESDLGLSNGASSKWNKSSPSGDVLQKVADYFDVSTDYLLGRTVFRNPLELLEHWTGNDPYFEPQFHFGSLLKEVRKAQGISQEEVSEALNITVYDVQSIEEGLLPLNYEWAKKYATFLDTSIDQIFFDNEMYDEIVPPHFEDDITAYENFRKAKEEDAKNEQPLKPTTVAAHLPEGVELTEEEQEDLDEYIQFILSRRKK